MRDWPGMRAQGPVSGPCPCSRAATTREGPRRPVTPRVVSSTRVELGRGPSPGSFCRFPPHGKQAPTTAPQAARDSTDAAFGRTARPPCLRHGRLRHPAASMGQPLRTHARNSAQVATTPATSTVQRRQCASPRVTLHGAFAGSDGKLLCSLMSASNHRVPRSNRRMSHCSPARANCAPIAGPAGIAHGTSANFRQTPLTCDSPEWGADPGSGERGRNTPTLAWQVIAGPALHRSVRASARPAISGVTVGVTV